MFQCSNSFETSFVIELSQIETLWTIQNVKGLENHGVSYGLNEYNILTSGLDNFLLDNHFYYIASKMPTMV